MKSKENNYASIDSQNVNLAIRDQGWVLDFERFRVYLKDKYKISKAYLFIGYVDGNSELYRSLQEKGFIIIFKPTLEKNGIIKGNCDAELVLHTMIEYCNYDKAVIVSGDGDFHCLVNYLIKQNKLKRLLIPNQKKYSALLKKINTSGNKYFAFMNNLQEKLSYKKKGLIKEVP